MGDKHYQHQIKEIIKTKYENIFKKDTSNFNRLSDNKTRTRVYIKNYIDDIENIHDIYKKEIIIIESNVKKINNINVIFLKLEYKNIKFIIINIDLSEKNNEEELNSIYEEFKLEDYLDDYYIFIVGNLNFKFNGIDDKIIFDYIINSKKINFFEKYKDHDNLRIKLNEKVNEIKKINNNNNLIKKLNLKYFYENLKNSIDELGIHITNKYKNTNNEIYKLFDSFYNNDNIEKLIIIEFMKIIKYKKISINLFFEYLNNKDLNELYNLLSVNNNKRSSVTNNDLIIKNDSINELIIIILGILLEKNSNFLKELVNFLKKKNFELKFENVNSEKNGNKYVSDFFKSSHKKIFDFFEKKYFIAEEKLNNIDRYFSYKNDNKYMSSRILYSIPKNKKIFNINRNNLDILLKPKKSSYMIMGLNLIENNSKNDSIIKLYNYEVQHQNQKLTNEGLTFENIFEKKYKMKKITNKEIKDNNLIKVLDENNKNINNLYENRKDNILFSKNKIKTINNSENEIKTINNLAIDTSINNELLNKLYNNVYLKKISRAKIDEINKIEDNFDEFNKLLNDCFEIIENYYKSKIKLEIDNKKNLNKKIFIKNNKIYKITTNKKVFVIGDTHGSFHSFFRIILRLIKQNILDEDLKLKDGAKIIILGDILDRGNYAYEILLILFNLIKINNIDGELNVILNRGNHEEINIFSTYGFKKEIEKKFINKNGNKLNNFFNELNKFFELGPSAIILKHKNCKYWLCHGGFTIDNNDDPIIFSDIYDDEIYILNNDDENILWSDFINNDETLISERGAGLLIGKKDLNYFLVKNKINFIIRGHQDNDYNFWLLKYNLKIKKTDIIETSLSLTHKKNYSELKKLNKIIKINDKNKKSKESIMEINSSIPFFNYNNDESLYPVLTISTNSDLYRKLFDDSYIILE